MITQQEFETMMQIARVVAATGAFGVKTQEDAFVRILTGHDLGLEMTASLRGISSIQGTPAPSAALMAGLALRSEQCEYLREIEADEQHAVYETKRVGQDPERATFTIDDAKRAGLTRSRMYQTYPRQMLAARCKVDLIRRVYPDVFMGAAYTPDELSDGAHVAVEDVPPTAILEAPHAPTKMIEQAVTEHAPPPVVEKPDDAGVMRDADGLTRTERRFVEQMRAAASIEEAKMIGKEAVRQGASKRLMIEEYKAVTSILEADK